MRKLLTLMLLVFFISISVHEIEAQSFGDKNAVSAKYLFVNYDNPSFGTFSEYGNHTRGVELTYYRSLGQHFNLGIPLKIGVGEFLQENQTSRKRQFGALDALLIYKIVNEDFIFSPYAFTGIGGMMEGKGSNNDADIHGEVPLGLGVNIKLSQNVYIQLQSEYRFSFSDDRDNTQAGLGFLWNFMKGDPPPLDTDGDGITDTEDSCPLIAGLASLQGCPDKDGDGIADKADDCPDVAGMPKYKGCPDTDGDGIIDGDDECPDAAGMAQYNGCPDTDGDGVADPKDKCPDQAGPASNDGCPETDSDGDGIADIRDECPDAAGMARFNGCPDSDGDGVSDPKDKCPSTKGTIANNGCPEIKKEDKETLTFAMENVEFNFAKATLKITSNSVLDQVEDIMKKYPNYSLSISGHTDRVGDAASNQLLSERRAKACLDYLIAKGIPGTRMSHVGYGETQPIGDNGTAAGRKMNRRVEFNIYLK